MKNTVVTITGTNFGTDTSKARVLFNGLQATVQSLTDTRITALVPAKAGSGPVTVIINAQSVQGPVFTYNFSWVVTTLAGNGHVGSTNGTGSAALFNSPKGVTVDSQFNVYVADYGNICIRKITPAGVVTTLAGDPAGFPGYGEGNGSAATFEAPLSISFDPVDNSLYVADGPSSGAFNNMVRKIALAGGGAAVTNVTRPEIGYLDGPLGGARFLYPDYLTVDAKGNIYVADEDNYRMRMISAAGLVSTIAGNGTLGVADGPALGPTFNRVWGVAIDAQGNIYFTENTNNSIRKLAGGNVTTLAGGTPGQGLFADGTGNAAKFNAPVGIITDKDGNIFVADMRNDCIREITPAGVVTTIAGSPGHNALVDGAGSDARFDFPYGITMDNQGTLYVAEFGNHAIRKITRE